MMATERYCWHCEEIIVGEQIPRHDPGDGFSGPLTDDDYLCEPCHENAVDAYMSSQVL